MVIMNSFRKMTQETADEIKFNETQIETVKKKIIKLNLNKTDLIDWLSDCLYFKNQKDLNNCDNDIKFRKNIYKLN